MTNEKAFSKSHEQISVWLWLAFKINENNCRLWFFAEFIQTQKRYPTCLDKISILTWGLLVISSKKRDLIWQVENSLQISHICRCDFKENRSRSLKKVIHQIDKKLTVSPFSNFYSKIWVGFCIYTGKRFVLF